MVNRTLFASSRSAGLTAKNEAGGKAYKMKPELALAQFAFTGTLSQTYYMKAESQLEQVLDLCLENKPEYVAKVAVAAREDGYMKDMPAMLLAYLNAKSPELLEKVFDRVIDNGKMLKKFVQIVRSGVTGRRGFGTRTKRVIRVWLEGRTDVQLMYDNIGGGNKAHAVALEHVLRMVRPRPKNKTRSALYAWIRGAKVEGDRLIQSVRYKKSGVFVDDQREYQVADLPQRVQDWLAYKANPESREEPPKVPFQMLTSLPLTAADWEVIGKNMSWQQLRQSLETLQRHDVFDSPRMVDYVCKKLRDPEEIAKARCFPYQLLATYLNTGPTPEGFGWTTRFWEMFSRNDKRDKGKGKASDAISIPKEIRNALEAAMEVAVQNVPTMPGQVFICPDTSGSMGYPITGDRVIHGKPPSTKVRCVDVAGLVTAAVLRRNPMAKALPFSTKVHDIALNPMDSVMHNAAKFTELGGGGTSCSEPLRVLNSLKAKGDTVIFVSDYESWSDPSGDRGTAMMREWNRFKVRNPEAKLVCIDIAPRRNHQATPNPDVLCIGGFSDQVFKIMEQFVTGKLQSDHWTGLIDSVEL